MQSIADRIKRDVERSLNRTFNTFDVLDYTLPTDTENSYYRMKIKTDDNGHVKVKTAEKEPGKDWDVHVEEYDKGRAIEPEYTSNIGNTGTLDLPSNTLLPSTGGLFSSIQSVADSIKRDVETSLGRTFNTFDVLDSTPSFDPANTYYDMKVKVDDNGHVKLKTAHKEPGKNWDVHVEEYDKGNAIDQSRSETRGITQGPGTTQNTLGTNITTDQA